MPVIDVLMRASHSAPPVKDIYEHFVNNVVPHHENAKCLQQPWVTALLVYVAPLYEVTWDPQAMGMARAYAQSLGRSFAIHVTMVSEAIERFQTEFGVPISRAPVKHIVSFEFEGRKYYAMCAAFRRYPFACSSRGLIEWLSYHYNRCVAS